MATNYNKRKPEMNNKAREKKSEKFCTGNENDFFFQKDILHKTHAPCALHFYWIKIFLTREDERNEQIFDYNRNHEENSL